MPTEFMQQRRLLNIFSGLDLVEYSGVHDDGRYVERVAIDEFVDSQYACGMFWQRWENVPIVFLHFPIKLDEREQFKLRYKCILESINQITQEFQPFYSLTVDEAVVDWPEVRIPNLEDFPYHYNGRTYRVLADQVLATGIFERLKAQNKWKYL